MKLTTIIVLICMQVQATGVAQSVTLNHRNAKAETVIQDIASQAKFNLVYERRIFKDAHTVSIQLTNVPFTDALEVCMQNQPFSYSIIGNSIVLSEKRGRQPVTIGTIEEVRGRVVDVSGKPIPAATIRTKRLNKSTSTDENGEFFISGLQGKTTLIVSCIGYNIQEVEINTDNLSSPPLTIILQVKNTELQEVTVQSVNTGYYEIPKDRATGSFDVIGNKLFNRRVGHNVIDRIDGIVSGVLFNKNYGTGGNIPSINVRGRSTILANAEPLIILDNFPYNGSLQNINPNDIESVTILKDAAAASIWGAYSGNGVIVLTSKKGKRNQPTKVSLNTNVTIGNRPNLYYVPQLSSSDFIGVEKYLFEKGAYDVYLEYIPYWPQSPAVEVFDLLRKNEIDQTEAEKRLQLLSTFDARKDQKKYIYRNNINQQYNLSISGGGKDNQFYLSVGYDKIQSSLKNDNQSRFTLTSQLTNYFWDDRIEFSGRVLVVNSKSDAPGQTYTPRYPYDRAADEDGSPLPIVRDYRLGYIDTLTVPGLLDWKYYPFKELDANTHSNLIDYKVDANINVRLIDGLKAFFNYQIGRASSTSTSTFDETHYSFRHLYNLFTSIDPLSGATIHSLPKGAIHSTNDGEYSNSFIRSGLTFNKNFSNKHEVNAIIGVESNRRDAFYKLSTLYGYDPITATSRPVDYNIEFPQFFGNTSKIPFNNNQYGSADRSRSYFANASYTFKEKYIFSGSVRKDESNLFGVKSNQKGVPLWSIGGSYEISKESFYRLNMIPYLRMRITYGFNGNVDKSTYAFTTINLSDYNIFLRPIASIINPANPSLRWEKVKTFNSAIDFSIIRNRIKGSIEYYTKKGMDLIGYSPVAPQTGVVRYKGNVANTSTYGFDFSITSRNINKSIKWTTDILFSIVKDKVTNNKIKSTNNLSYVSTNSTNPLEGYPYASLYSFKWAGLDSVGDPLGYIDGKVTKEYAKILNSTNTSELVYSGSFTPTRFGSLRNNILYKGIELSVNITYKGGYVFRKEALQYGNLFNGAFRGSQDYVHRWQRPGDELRTNIPAAKYPNDPRRDDFFRFSEINILKADHLRLQDVRLSYDFLPKSLKELGFSSLSVYGYINNIAILWRANKESIDPDAGSFGLPAPTTYSMGVNVQFK